MKTYISLIALFITFYGHSQTAWTWTELDLMPKRISNNAVAFGSDNDYDYVFSFGGIDSTKIHSGITKQAFRYNLGTSTWDEIAPLPFTLSNIASGASTVKNIIYIIGGYHVEESDSEISSNEIIRYDPSTNSYLPNGAEIPVPIDDHVQCVWRDSLIYVVTGWSNVTNVPNVQIYNPALDNWTAGASTPNNNLFKAFGASGEIIGDTIYYYGGASTGFNFPAQKRLRKGVINAANPVEITWTELGEGPNTLYRSAALTTANSIFWVGGSATSFNFDGIAYNGSGGVSPLTQISRYDHTTGNWFAGEGAPYGVMDLRGVAQTTPTTWVICGGMEEDQEVSQRTFLLTYDPVVGSINTENKQSQITIIDNSIVLSEPAKQIALYSLDGKFVQEISLNDLQLPIDLKGAYIINVHFDNGMVSKKIIR